MEFFLSFIDWLLYVVISVNVLYLFVFSVASCWKSHSKPRIPGAIYPKILVLIPAYKEDAVIEECVGSCLHQTYPSDRYDVVVISDQMQPATIERLKQNPIVVEQVNFKNSTKAKALNLAMSTRTGYDLVVIFDADNTVYPDFLQQAADAFQCDKQIGFQAHRTAKNKNTSMAYLDAVSEEINNSIFREGHVRMGLSSALIGSGMIFRYEPFKEILGSIDAVGGFDRALELTFFRQRLRIGYLPQVDVLDEKIQSHQDFSNQRRRWMSAQIHYLGKFFRYLPGELMRGNWDFCDKLFQQMIIPRVLLAGITLFILILAFILDTFCPFKWLFMLALLMVAFLIAIPRKLYTPRLLWAMLELPVAFFNMVKVLFHLKGANKKFIHTTHGVNQK